MPVIKFTSVEQAERTTWLAPTDPRLWSMIDACWRLAATLAPPAFPPGVYKHRSIEDANRQTARWQSEAMDRARSRRRPGPATTSA